MNIRYPKGELVWVTILLPETHEPSYIITSRQQRDYYYLYSVSSDGSLVKIHRGRNPLEFETKINYYEGGHDERQKKKKAR